ncbi:MAG: glycosyltransferase [Acidobacteriia bacterium]|nr:glycosyltransferase [Terriglobia bacterium]
MPNVAPILTYHSCSPEPAPEIPAFDNITPERLYAQISSLKRLFRLIPVDELANCLSPRRVAAITFDDGYRSVLTHALPVFEALNVPFTIFVNTFPFTGRRFWRHKVRYLVNQGLTADCERFFGNTLNRYPGETLADALKNPANHTPAVEEKIDRFLKENGLNPEIGDHFLSRPADFVRHPLIWYGNHSHSHHVLASLSFQEQLEELRITKNFLAGIPGIQLSRSVAVPFGRTDHANRDTLSAVKESGYEVLLLNRGGFNRTHMRSMGVRILERFSATEASLAWNLVREAMHPVPSPQSLVPSPQTPAPNFQSPAPSPQSLTSGLRILQLVNSLDFGGAERMASSLSLQLEKLGHNVDMVCLRDFGRMTVPLERFASAGIRVSKFGKGDGMNPSCLWKLARFLKSERIDVIHSHNPLVTHYAAAAALLAGTPLTVSTIHGISTLQLRTWERALFSASCRLTDRIVLVCREVQKEFCHRFPALAGRTTAIPNGIDLDELLSLPRRAPSAEFVFGAAGRLVPVKDHQTLLVAFSRVHSQYPSSRLEILGDGELRGQLEHLASSLGLSNAVRFHGWSNDIARFLSRIDTFVLSSLSEGLPMAVLEAMAAGLPIVSTAVGGVPEIIESAQCGWLAQPQNPEDLGQKMIHAITHSAEGQGRRARSAVQEQYSAARMAQNYATLFQSALNQSGAGAFACQPAEGRSARATARHRAQSLAPSP